MNKALPEVPTAHEGRGWNLVGGSKQSLSSGLKGLMLTKNGRMDRAMPEVPTEHEQARGWNLVGGPEESLSSKLEGCMLKKN